MSMQDYGLAGLPFPGSFNHGVDKIIDLECRGFTFIECTAMSMRPSSNASSISFVKRPFPPMSARGWLRILSPVVLMMQISSAPSSRSSGNASCKGRC